MSVFKCMCVYAHLNFHMGIAFHLMLIFKKLQRRMNEVEMGRAGVTGKEMAEKAEASELARSRRSENVRDWKKRRAYLIMYTCGVCVRYICMRLCIIRQSVIHCVCMRDCECGRYYMLSSNGNRAQL